MPEQKAPPAPVRTAQRMSSSSSTSTHASAIPTSMAGESAFLASGRFMVTTSVWASRSVVRFSVLTSPPPWLRSSPARCPAELKRVLLQHVEFNLGDLFEQAVDHFPDREYLVAGNDRRTYREMDERANRLAHHLAEQGVKPGDHVGIYGYNTAQWVEALWAVFKLRATWININYRYVEDELAYLVGNADLVALIHQAEFADRVNAVKPHLPLLRHTLVMDGREYEQALAEQSPERDFPTRSGDDRYILYTGGTTGMPKGVVWRHEDVFFALR